MNVDKNNDNNLRNQIFANNLMTLRKGHSVTQEEISKYIGIDRSSYSNYERGFRSPNFDVLINIASFYNISTDFFTRSQRV